MWGSVRICYNYCPINVHCLHKNGKIFNQGLKSAMTMTFERAHIDSGYDIPFKFAFLGWYGV